MASTYTLNSHSYDGRYLQLTCSQTADTSSNSSTVKWTLTVKGGADNYYSTGPTTVKINGETVYSKARVAWNETAFPAGPPGASTSGTLIVKHNSNGAKSITCSISTDIYNASPKTSSGTWTLNSITRNATITSFPATFTDEDKPVLKYSNVSGSSVTKIEACMRHFQTAEILVPYRELSKTGTSYTFNLTDTERANLRKVAPDGYSSGLVLVYLTTTIGSNTYHEFVRATLNIVNANPTLTPYIETDTLTQNLTGSPDKVIKYATDVYVEADYAAIKGSTVKSFSVSNGGKTEKAVPTSFVDVENGSFVFTVTDSRNNTTTKTITKEVVDYVKLTCSLEAENPTPDEANSTMTFTISGNWFPGSFGAVSNSIAIRYRIKVKDEDYPKDSKGNDVWTNVNATPTLKNNTYTVTKTIPIDDYKKSYVIQAQATDKITTVNSVEKTVKTIPVFDWGEEDFNFNVPVSFMGDTMADFVIEEGTESMGSNGTWYWRKWKSGRADCYGTRNYGNMAVTTAWGNLYRSESFSQSLPSGLFKDIPAVIDIVYRGSNYGGWIVKHEGTSPSTSASGGFILVRPASATISQAYIGFNVIGRWK